MGYKIALFFHLIGFASFVGAGFAQTRFMKASRRASIAAQMRDTYEALAASIVTKIELPAIFLQLLTGLYLLYERPFWLRNPWMHVKLTAVFALLVLAHLEMFSARKIVRARLKSGDAAAGEIAERKGRHEIYGRLGALLVLVVLVAVSFGLRP